jgi:ATP-dependent Clp protease ATP-binding subunit ClpB
MGFLNINETVKTAINQAMGIARDNGNPFYTPAHLLKAILGRECGLTGFLQNMDKDIAYLIEWAETRMDECQKSAHIQDITPSVEIPIVFEEADNARLKLGLLEINPVCVLAALAKPETGFTANQLKSFPLREKEIFDLYSSSPALSHKNTAAGFNNTGIDDNTPQPLQALLKYCIDKSAMATENLLQTVVCRDAEKRQMMEILGRLSKPNVMITGNAGVGKTALVNGLAIDIANGAVPSFLKEAVIYELDTGALIAGATYKGEIEDRLKNVIRNIRSLNQAILFIDEIHVLLDSKAGNAGAGSILKQELSRGEITVIGSTTRDEYRKLIEPDSAFSRRFEELFVAEPDITAAGKMVDSVLPGFMNYHNIKVSQKAVDQSVRLSKRYIRDRHLPDAAIDLLDRTMSAVKMINETSRPDIDNFTAALADIEAHPEFPEDQKFSSLQEIYRSMQNKLSPVLLGMITLNDDPAAMETVTELFDYLFKSLDILRNFTRQTISEVDEHEVAAVISNKTGIPIGKLQSGEKERLLHMDETLRCRVVGQDNAIKSLVDAILESRSGMNKQGQPVGSFFFLGPTGTGKTELAKALAEALFNDEKAMIRFDMSEFKEEHSAALLYGAPPGYVGYEEGGLLVNKIRSQPYSVVLFDEIEKAHTSVYDIFLQIMDEGKLHDRLGKEGDFSNAIVIFTSNVGSEWITQQLAAGRNPATTEIMEVMGKYFRPEFLARISEIVPFAPIGEDILLKIFDIQFRGLTDLLDKKGIAITLTDETKKMLAFKGFTPKYGARQVAGVIRNYLRRPISRLIISNQLAAGNSVLVNINQNQELIWDIQ